MGKVYITTKFDLRVFGKNLEHAELKITPATREEIYAVLEAAEYITDIDYIGTKQMVAKLIGLPLVYSNDRLQKNIRLYTGDVMYVVQPIDPARGILDGIWDNIDMNRVDVFLRKIEIVSKRGRQS